MTQRSALLDKGKGYWSSTLERAARAFESHVQARMLEQGFHNDFLANVKAVEDTKRSPERYPYLLPGEVKPIAEAFDALFADLKTRENDNGNVALYSRSDRAPVGLDVATAKTLAAKHEAAGLNKINVAATTIDLPGGIRELFEAAGEGGARGAYFAKTDETWVVADKLASP